MTTRETITMQTKSNGLGQVVFPSTGGKTLSFLGHGHYLRRRKPQQDKVCKNEIKRVARKGGVKRISNAVFAEAQKEVNNVLKASLEKSIIYLPNKTKTLTKKQVKLGLAKIKKKLYI